MRRSEVGSSILVTIVVAVFNEAAHAVRFASQPKRATKGDDSQWRAGTVKREQFGPDIFFEMEASSGWAIRTLMSWTPSATSRHNDPVNGSIHTKNNVGRDVSTRGQTREKAQCFSALQTALAVLSV